jgi:hypothetical protein
VHSKCETNLWKPLEIYPRVQSVFLMQLKLIDNCVTRLREKAALHSTMGPAEITSRFQVQSHGPECISAKALSVLGFQTSSWEPMWKTPVCSLFSLERYRVTYQQNNCPGQRNQVAFMYRPVPGGPPVQWLAPSFIWNRTPTCMVPKPA